MQSAIQNAFPSYSCRSALEPQERLRICVPTWRNFNKAAFNCGLYEAQDVLQEIDDVDLVALEPRAGFRFKESWQRLLLYRDPTDRLMFLNPGLKRVRITRDYELFAVVCQSYWDLLYVNAIEGWKEKCRTSVCWIDEMWAASVHKYKNWLKALASFDHVCVSSKRSAPALSSAIGRECHWIPGGVDALRFSPYPDPPARVVDVYSIGRRWEGMHKSFLESASKKEIFYIHDTLQDIASMRPIDDRQHRELYANVAKRSRYFVVAPAKMDLPADTEGESEIGYRYFEGAASGAVLVGQAPVCEHYPQMFGWPDAVVEVRPDGSDLRDVLSALNSDPARISKISRRNSAESLLRHDWVYRWKDIFRIAGVTPSPGMIARERCLARLASTAMGDGAGQVSLA
jgi:hypothetical protein